MRYPAERKEETRQKILQTAARRFRASGGAVGIADLMRELDLTHGGFYRHFDSKDQLFGESLGKALDEIRSVIHDALRKARPGAELRTVIETYLSTRHCADISGGCPLAALAGEVGRSSPSVRKAMDRWMREHLSHVSPLLPGKTDEERRANALVLFSGMSGTLAVARAVADKALREKLLADARRFYIEAFDA